MKRAFLGELEELVLLTVAALQEQAYCASVTQTIEQQIARSISFPTVHVTLQRLEEKGFASSRHAYWATTAGLRKANWRYLLAVLRLIRPFSRSKARKSKSQPECRTIFKPPSVTWA